MKTILILLFTLFLTSCSNVEQKEYYYPNGIWLTTENYTKKYPLIKKVIFQKEYVELYYDKETESPYLIIRLELVNAIRKIYSK